MKPSLLFSALAFCAAQLIVPPAAHARTDGDVIRQLTQLNAKLQIATKNFDTASLAKLITDNYELVSSSGKVYDRAAFLADAADRSIAYELNEPEDVVVRQYADDAAVVTAILHVRYRTGDRTVDVRIRYGDLWVKQNGEWRYAFGEASKIKADDKAAVVKGASSAMAAFSSANRTAFIAAFTAAPSIIDDVSPYVFRDAGAWFDAVRPLFRTVSMTPGTPLEVLIEGDRAFVAVPISVSGESAKGKSFTAGGFWTGTLVRVVGSWRIDNATLTVTN